MMHFYHELCFGPKAAEKSHTLKRQIRHLKALPGIYVIVLSDHPDHQLEMFEMLQFQQPGMDYKDYYVLGIAQGRNEGLELIRQLTEKTVLATGTANMKEFFGK